MTNTVNGGNNPAKISGNSADGNAADFNRTKAIAADPTPAKHSEASDQPTPQDQPTQPMQPAQTAQSPQAAQPSQPVSAEPVQGAQPQAAQTPQSSQSSPAAPAACIPDAPAPGMPIPTVAGPKPAKAPGAWTLAFKSIDRKVWAIFAAGALVFGLAGGAASAALVSTVDGGSHSGGFSRHVRMSGSDSSDGSIGRSGGATQDGSGETRVS